MTCRWAVGTAWLVSEGRLEIPGQGAYEVMTAVRYDGAAGRYRAHSFNSFGQSVEYEGMWQDERTLVFDAVRTKEDRRARVVYTRNADGTVGFRAEQAEADGTFHPYFDSLLSREPGASAEDPPRRERLRE